MVYEPKRTEGSKFIFESSVEQGGITMIRNLGIVITGMLLGVGFVACNFTSSVEMDGLEPNTGNGSTLVEEETPIKTFKPTQTPKATSTPSPTDTQTPTLSPTDTSTPTPEPTPIGGGGLIAFSSIRLGSSYSNPEMDIFVLNPNDGEIVAITSGENDDFNSSPSWSPDGSEILFTKIDGFNSIGKGGQLYSVDLKSGQESEVDSPFGGGLYHPSWSLKDEIIVSRTAGREYPQLWEILCVFRSSGRNLFSMV